MKTLFTTAAVTAAVAMTAQAWPAQPWALIADRDASKFTGKWYAVDEDSREFNIERTSDGLKMHASDLLCTIKHLEIHHDFGLSADGQFECTGEGEAARGSWLLKLIGSGYLAVVERVTATQSSEDGSEDANWKKANWTTVYVYSRRNEHHND
jgi:hypothetical protein